MCGIQLDLVIGQCDKVANVQNTCNKAVESPSHFLRRRGPDISSNYTCIVPHTGICIHLWQTLLHIRGQTKPVCPLQDSLGNVLLFNGEIYGGLAGLGCAENDGQVLLNELGKYQGQTHVSKTLAQLYGPWSVIYFQKDGGKLWFGRDFLGRRSLLKLSDAANNTISISSVIGVDERVESGHCEVAELPPGLYYLDVSTPNLATTSRVERQLQYVPWDKLYPHWDLLANQVRHLDAASLKTRQFSQHRRGNVEQQPCEIDDAVQQTNPRGGVVVKSDLDVELGTTATQSMHQTCLQGTLECLQAFQCLQQQDSSPQFHSNGQGCQPTMDSIQHISQQVDCGQNPSSLKPQQAWRCLMQSGCIKDSSLVCARQSAILACMQVGKQVADVFLAQIQAYNASTKAVPLQVQHSVSALAFGSDFAAFLSQRVVQVIILDDYTHSLLAQYFDVLPLQQNACISGQQSISQLIRSCILSAFDKLLGTTLAKARSIVRQDQEACGMSGQPQISDNQLSSFSQQHFEESTKVSGYQPQTNLKSTGEQSILALSNSTVLQLLGQELTCRGAQLAVELAYISKLFYHAKELLLALYCAVDVRIQTTPPPFSIQKTHCKPPYSESENLGLNYNSSSSQTAEQADTASDGSRHIEQHDEAHALHKCKLTSNVDGSQASQLHDSTHSTMLPASRLLVLFSGGIDSTLVAALSLAALPQSESIDLSSVCFVNGDSPDRKTAQISAQTLSEWDQQWRQRQRSLKQGSTCSVLGSANKRTEQATSTQQNYLVGKEQGQASTDGIDGLQEDNLRDLHDVEQAGYGRIRLIEVNSNLDEIDKLSPHLLSLLYPCSTHMDFNVGSALWLATKAVGTINPCTLFSNNPRPTLQPLPCGGDLNPTTTSSNVDGTGKQQYVMDCHLKTDRAQSSPNTHNTKATNSATQQPSSSCAGQLDAEYTFWKAQQSLPRQLSQAYKRNNVDQPQLGPTQPLLQYTSQAKVVFVGHGADELCGGYSRHRTKFRESGWRGLSNELSLDMGRMWLRNFGRDDRIMSDLGRECRHPFVDNVVMEVTRSCPVNCLVDPTLPASFGDKIILRVVAMALGLGDVARHDKRAIQFGSRIGKLNNVRVFGSNRAANKSMAGGVAYTMTK